MFRVLSMNALAQRLTEVMRELGLERPKDLADFCGVSDGLVAQWFSGQTKLGPKPLKAFARTKFSLDWITEGRGPKYRDDNQERQVTTEKQQGTVLSDLKWWVTIEEYQLLELYRDTDGEGRQTIMTVAANMPKASAATTRANEA